jgi:hypothetical protein
VEENKFCPIFLKNVEKKHVEKESTFLTLVYFLKMLEEMEYCPTFSKNVAIFYKTLTKTC